MKLAKKVFVRFYNCANAQFQNVKDFSVIVDVLGRAHVQDSPIVGNKMRYSIAKIRCEYDIEECFNGISNIFLILSRNF